MRKLLLLLTLAPLAANARLPSAGADDARCGAISRPIADRAGPARPRPLNEMPPARAVLTVYREDGGCPVILVRDGARIIEEPVGRPERRRVFIP